MIPVARILTPHARRLFHGQPAAAAEGKMPPVTAGKIAGAAVFIAARVDMEHYITLFIQPFQDLCRQTFFGPVDLLKGPVSREDNMQINMKIPT